MLYPNPFTNNLNVFVENWDTSDLEIELYDLLGNKIKEWNDKNIPSSFHKSINLDGLAPAVYVIRIRTANGTIMRKVEKQ
jgi:hypothetical protein